MHQTEHTHEDQDHNPSDTDHQHNGHRHEHGLRSSREHFDAPALLRQTGLGPDQTFLDIGCGDGHFSIAAAGIVGPNGIVHAIDVEPLGIEMVLKEAHEKGIENITAEVMDATKGLPQHEKGSGYDSILISNVLHGFVANGEFEQVMENITSVQVSGGKVIIIEFKKEETEFGPPVEVRLSEDDVERLFGQNGYSLDSRIDAGPAHYLLTFNQI